MKLTRHPQAFQSRFRAIITPTLRITRKFKSKPSKLKTFLTKLGVIAPGRRLELPELFAALKGLYSTKKLLGEGVFGSTYVFRDANPKFLSIIAAASNGYVVKGRPLAPRQHVAVKVIRHTSQNVFPEFDREVQTLTYLQKKEATVIGKTTYIASQYVPKLHLACHFPDFSVVVESYAPGRPLAKYTNVTPRTVARLERALVSLWLAGVAHADLHSENIMYDDRSKKLTIIDFGHAVIMSPEAVQMLKKNLVGFTLDPARNALLKRPDVLKLIARNIVVQSTNVTHFQTGIKRYLDDETMSQYHVIRRCLRPKCSPEALVKERLGTWVPILK